MVGCMEMVPACSQECSEAFVACVESRAGASASSRETDYYECLESGLSGCESDCAPTLDMLRVVEKPCLVDGVCSHGETQATALLTAAAMWVTVETTVTTVEITATIKLSNYPRARAQSKPDVLWR